ncbi:MAG TPA: class I SAM-dependent methyltransferase [Opitutaceae bacterium]|nr:class I SAM-dependent methyltransferase [Opitutaceae bacterium]
MLLRLAALLLESSPFVRRMLWRWWYGRLAKRHIEARWTFMNYGFAPTEGSQLALEAADEPDRLCIQLYHRVASAAELKGKTVLEVGSGRGGGASFIARYHEPASITGVDFSEQAVALSTLRHAAVENLQFLVGDAENLPFPAASFDAVVNVESSHCYGHIEKFFSEVSRVLRPGGWFLYTDFRATEEMKRLHATLAEQHGLERIEREDITADVAAALEADDVRKRRLIEQNIPPRFRSLFGEFAGLTGGQIHRGFVSHDLVYHRFAFRRT